MSPPTVATTIQNNPKLGFSYGPHFYMKSFYATPYCRDYVQVNLTGYVRVRSMHASVHLGVRGFD